MRAFSARAFGARVRRARVRSPRARACLPARSRVRVCARASVAASADGLVPLRSPLPPITMPWRLRCEACDGLAKPAWLCGGVLGALAAAAGSRAASLNDGFAEFKNTSAIPPKLTNKLNELDLAFK
eukprot:7365226-Alexandrium_andersonii.AAC.1